MYLDYIWTKRVDGEIQANHFHYQWWIGKNAYPNQLHHKVSQFQKKIWDGWFWNRWKNINNLRGKESSNKEELGCATDREMTHFGGSS